MKSNIFGVPGKLEIQMIVGRQYCCLFWHRFPFSWRDSGRIIDGTWSVVSRSCPEVAISTIFAPGSNHNQDGRVETVSSDYSQKIKSSLQRMQYLQVHDDIESCYLDFSAEVVRISNYNMDCVLFRRWVQVGLFLLRINNPFVLVDGKMHLGSQEESVMSCNLVRIDGNHDFILEKNNTVKDAKRMYNSVRDQFSCEVNL